VSHKFHDVTHHGLDAVAVRFIQEAQLLMADANPTVSLNSSRLEYIWQVGNADLFDGMKTADEVSCLRGRLLKEAAGAGCDRQECAAIAAGTVKNRGHTTHVEPSAASCHLCCCASQRPKDTPTHLPRPAWCGACPVQEFRSTVFGVLDQLKLVHIVIFLLSLGGCLFFLLALVRPFLRRTSKETRQIAEMLSQLPNDMDLEALVGQALAAGGSRAGRVGASASSGSVCFDTPECCAWLTGPQQPSGGMVADLDGTNRCR
jgi:hypothetical protein